MRAHPAFFDADHDTLPSLRTVIAEILMDVGVDRAVMSQSVDDANSGFQMCRGAQTLHWIEEREEASIVERLRDDLERARMQIVDLEQRLQLEVV